MTWSALVADAPAAQARSSREAPDLEVVVLGATSPLDTGSLFGQGRGVLASDRSVAVTFLLRREDFAMLRDQVLLGVRDLTLTVRAADVTSVDIGG